MEYEKIYKIVFGIATAIMFYGGVIYLTLL